MSTANLNVDGIAISTERQILAEREAKTRETIHWGRVLMLPAIVLFLMVFCGLVVTGHTHYIETGSDRLIAHTDQFVAGTIKELSTSDSAGSHR